MTKPTWNFNNNSSFTMTLGRIIRLLGLLGILGLLGLLGPSIRVPFIKILLRH